MDGYAGPGHKWLHDDCEWCVHGCFGMQASFIGAFAISDMVKTTLGPKGMVSTTMCMSKQWMQGTVVFVQHTRMLLTIVPISF